MVNKRKLIKIVLTGIGIVTGISKLRRMSNDMLIDNINADWRWDGYFDPKYEYGSEGVVVGKDGRPKLKKK